MLDLNFQGSPHPRFLPSSTPASTLNSKQTNNASDKAKDNNSNFRFPSLHPHSSAVRLPPLAVGQRSTYGSVDYHDLGLGHTGLSKKYPKLSEWTLKSTQYRFLSFFFHDILGIGAPSKPSNSPRTGASDEQRICIRSALIIIETFTYTSWISEYGPLSVPMECQFRCYM